MTLPADGRTCNGPLRVESGSGDDRALYLKALTSG